MASGKTMSLSDFFKRGGISNPGTVNNTSLIGTFFAKDTECTGLPSSTKNWYYSIVAFGTFQICMKYVNNASPTTEVYTRFYINDTWQPWKSVRHIEDRWLPTGTSLNDVIDQGTYGLSGDNTYSNMPPGVTYGQLEVFGNLVSGAYIMQRITAPGCICVRYRSGNNGTTFASWYKYTGTQLT